MILLDASLRISIVAVVAGLVLMVMRVRASGVRHTVWTGVLAAMVLMPFLTSIVPTFDVMMPAAAVAVPSVVQVLPEPLNPSISPAVEPLLRSAVPAVSTGPGAPVANRWPLALIVRTIYLFGAGVLLVRLLIGWRAAARLTRHAQPVAFCCDAPVRESPLVATPVTAGILAPTIILPTSWTAWPADKLRACMAHELAHIARRDPLVALIARINRCVFWFHPLAWWLERTLAASAEEAADEAAVDATGDRRVYAGVLIEIADAVRARGARIAWQGIGAEGTGRLGRRIDRVLRGDAVREMSRWRKAIVFATCAAATVIVVACRPEQGVSALQPDPAIAEELATQNERSAFDQRAANLTAADVDALEKSLTRTAADLETLRTLQVFYQQSGQKVFGWNDMIARRRPHMLWLIEHHPDHEMDVWRVSADADPIGYAEAKTRWLAQTAKPDASVRVLSNAAYFLERADAPLAEQLLLRAISMTTGSERLWEGPRFQLGRLYGEVLRGPTDPRDGSPQTRLDSSSYVRDVRQRLAESRDATLLSVAAERLAQTYRDEERRQLGRQLLERALQIDPQHTRARRLLMTHDAVDRNRQLITKVRRRAAALAGGAITAKQISRERLTPQEQAKIDDMEPHAVSELSDYERFVLLPELAFMAHMRGESRWGTDRAASDASYARSKTYAQEALALAPTFANDADYGRVVYQATVTLAAHAFREGDRKNAVRHLLAAVNVPPSRGLDGYTYSLDGRLVNDLLKAGERESVAQFLEGSARLRPAERESFLKDASAIRAGTMPMSFQYMVSR
jgi:beta-lactamase regulating signal transducer with metallopeptidase domain